MEIRIPIGAKIKALRKQHDMTQEKLADYLGWVWFDGLRDRADFQALYNPVSLTE